MFHLCNSSYRNFFILLVLTFFLQGCGFLKISLAPSSISGQGERVVKTAYSQIGNKYCPGGNSPGRGFDCSGLIWWAYKQNGVNIPRITREQSRTGFSVSKINVRSGDIVVFRLGRGPYGLHTGLYAGNGNFIHSPRTGKKVCMDNMDKSYWQEHLIAVRRVFR